MEQKQENSRERRLPVFFSILTVGIVLITIGVNLRASQEEAVEVAVVSTITALAPTATATDVPPTLTATATPTQTLTPTPGPSPTLGPTNTPLPTPIPPRPASINTDGYPTPSEPSSTAIPTPVEPISVPPGVVNVMLLGSDKRPDDPGFRTDVIMIVSINTQENTVNLLSIPRDLFVYVPGWTVRKINTAYGRGESVGHPGGGAGLLKETLLYNMGIRVDYYAFVEFRAFQEIVDVLGTIEVPVDCSIEGQALREPRRTPDDFATYAEWVEYTDPEENPDNWVDFGLDVGVQELDGYEALWYARTRKGSSDFDRAVRQQQVLRAILNEARAQGFTNLTNIPELWRQYNDLVQTDMGVGNMLQFAPIARELDTVEISSFIITPDLLEYWNNEALDQDGYVLRPDVAQSLIAIAMQPPAQNYIASQTATVEIRNGTTFERLDEVAADRLALYSGLSTTATGAADSDQYESSVIYDFTGREKTSSLLRLQREMRVADADVIIQPDPNRTYDYVVILGDNYRSCTRNDGVAAVGNQNNTRLDQPEEEATPTLEITPTVEEAAGDDITSTPDDASAGVAPTVEEAPAQAPTEAIPPEE